MKAIPALILIFLFVSNSACGNKGTIEPVLNQSKCDSCIDIYGFLIHKQSKSIYSNDGSTLEKVIADSGTIHFHYEVFDIRKEEAGFLNEQIKAMNFKKLPVKEMKLKIDNKFLAPGDGGFYLLLLPQGNIFGSNRFLIINLKKKYLIWYQFG